MQRVGLTVYILLATAGMFASQQPAARPPGASSDEERLREMLRDPVKRAALMREHCPENPRNKPGFHVLATVDEKSYEPGKPRWEQTIR